MGRVVMKGQKRILGDSEVALFLSLRFWRKQSIVDGQNNLAAESGESDCPQTVKGVLHGTLRHISARGNGRLAHQQ